MNGRARKSELSELEGEPGAPERWVIIMPWIDGHISVNHPRAQWDATTPSHVLVHQRLSWIYGTDAAIPARERKRRQVLYKAAKRQLDLDAALELVQKAIRAPVYDTLVKIVLVAGGLSRLRIVLPHPAFEEATNEPDPVSGPTNAIPHVFAWLLAQRLDCPVDEEIDQVARVGRTDFDRFERFLWQPSFQGDVAAGHRYIIADDVVTFGATFAALRSHIVRNGGTVCAVTALGHKDGVHQRFPIGGETLRDLGALYGPDLRAFWKRTVGHDVETLTDAEGAFLREWGRQQKRDGIGPGEPLLHRLRNRLDQAASKVGE